MVPRCRDREGAYLEILPNKPQPGVRISIMPNLPRSGLNAFPAVVMHPQLTREGRSHPSSLQLPSLSLPSPNTHRTQVSSALPGKGSLPGGHGSLRGGSELQVPRDSGAWESAKASPAGSSSYGSRFPDHRLTQPDFLLWGMEAPRPPFSTDVAVISGPGLLLP